MCVCVRVIRSDPVANFFTLVGNVVMSDIVPALGVRGNPV